MAWRLLPIVLGSCLLFFSYGEENESHTALQRANLVPVASSGPKAMHEDEAAVFGLEQKYKSPDIMLMNYRLPRHAEKKKKKHNAGAFSPLSMPPDGKKTHNSRNKRQEMSTGKKRLLKHHEQLSPSEKPKVPKKKHAKKPKPPGVFSVLSYSSHDIERSNGQIEDSDD